MKQQSWKETVQTEHTAERRETYSKKEGPERPWVKRWVVIDTDNMRRNVALVLENRARGGSDGLGVGFLGIGIILRVDLFHVRLVLEIVTRKVALFRFVHPWRRHAAGWLCLRMKGEDEGEGRTTAQKGG
jgi:hypothetical protein